MGFLRPKTPAPPPKSETTKEYEATRDREYRKEKVEEKKRTSAGIRRRRGRTLLTYRGDTGLKDDETLG
mgnify:CR=1 FL=1|jgi:hypothetical protein